MSCRAIFLFFFVSGGLCFLQAADARVYEVMPTVETEPVSHSGDRADDATVWVHPTDPGKSVIIGTDKDDSDGGLAVYDLAGTQLYFVTGGKMNNIDVRYNFPIGRNRIDIIAVGNRTDDSIAIFSIDPDTRQLRDIAARKIYIGIEEAYGFCLYQSWRTNKYYAFVNDKNGEVEQWELFHTVWGRIDAFRVRSFDVGGQTEGMVADDQLACLYVGEEDDGIWKYGAEPNDPTDDANRVLVDTTADGGHLAADVEGLAIYYAEGGQGYLIASSQGEGSSGHPLVDTYTVYQRQGNNDFVMSFRIAENSALGIDAVSNTDGIAAVSVSLGPHFPRGLFLAQDGSNTDGNQNFKLVPWESIAEAITPNLKIDTGWNPRAKCGRQGYLPADFNKDCRINFEDFALIPCGWLDFEDVSFFTGVWLDCNLEPPEACWG